MWWGILILLYLVLSELYHYTTTHLYFIYPLWKNACAVSQLFGAFFSRSSSAASEDVCLLLRKEAPSYLRTQYISSNVSLQMWEKPEKKMSSSTTTTSKNTLRSRLPRFNFLKKAPKKVAESKLDKDLANFVEKVSHSNSRKNSSTTDAAACSVLSAKDKQNTNIKLR